jgi:Porin subfamily
MKLFKSLLLASATGLVAVSGASAADLGAKKPSPVEYVRACYNPLWGTSGGFIIPGTQTCLRVFGQARFDVAYTQPFIRTASPMGYRGGMTVGLDAITPSEYGNVRAFAAIGAMYRSGNQFSGTNIRQGTAFGGTFPTGTNSGGQTEINYAGFIQFAGFTLGRTASFFRTVGAPNQIIGLSYFSDPGNVTTAAYTAQLGNGFLATIAIEDPTITRFGVVGQSLQSNNGVIFVPNIVAGGGFGVAPGFVATAANILQTGNRMPNILASIRVDQAWGSAELSGMINEVGVVGNLPGFNPANFAFTGFNVNPGTKYGFSVRGGLKINLPMIAAGDNFTLDATYTQGNLSTVLSNGGGNLFAGWNNGGIAAVVANATVNQFTGNMTLTKAWAVTAGFQHFWTPTLSSSIFGSYARIDVANVPLFVNDTLRDFNLYTVGLNTIWQPVRGLNIGLEGGYQNVQVQGRMADVNKNVVTNVNGAAVFTVVGCNVVTGVNCRLKSSDGQFFARLRITRDF